MAEALLVIDVQNDYFPGGRMELSGSVGAGEALRKFIAEARSRGLELLYVQHISRRPGSSFFLEDTPGAELYDRIAPLEGERIFVKHYPNSFRETGLHEYCRSRGIAKLVVAGMMTHMCVDTTVRAAFDLGYELVLLEDCCATKSLQRGAQIVDAAVVQAAYIAALDGTFCSAMSSREYLATD